MLTLPDPDWPNVIAHIDADCFFAACELIRHPELIGSPVCILSSHDACVIAKTYDAKAAGIHTGMPIWDAKKIMPHATYLSADFRFYGLISEKMFSILRRYSPDIELYSIDEAFLDLNTIRQLWHQDYQSIAHDIRRSIHKELGITVSVGVSITRTLAKMASEYNKPNGVSIVPNSMIRLFLARTELSDITGIGRNREALLHKLKIHTPLDFVNTELQAIQHLLGKAGTDLWHELHGKSVIGLELHVQCPKSVSRTASMGEISHDRTIIIAHLIGHTSRLAMELVTKRLLSKRITIFLQLKNFNSVSANTDFEYPSNNYFRLSHAVKTMFDDLFQAGELYRSCGITAEKINQSDTAQADLFGIMKADAKQAGLLLTMDSINKRYGSNTVKMAGAYTGKQTKRRMRFAYPLIIAS